MSDEVSNFLRSVEQLNQRGYDDDGARQKEMEEKILQQRRERQARREERARSISPQKSSPANTPPPSAFRKDPNPKIEYATASTIADLGSHTLPSTLADPMDRSPVRSASPVKGTEVLFDVGLNRSSGSCTSLPNSAGLSRTPTLSWQRRPQSQGSGPSSRPLSMLATENAAARSSTPAEEATSPDLLPSLDQNPRALAGKDHSSFRQTADRACQKNQVEDTETVDVLFGHSRLSGMYGSISTEAAMPRSRPTSQLGSKTGSPLLTDAPNLRLDPPAAIQENEDTLRSGRTSPSRPPSPMKGMGGFVQSAMMKRTDSVKRWSVTTSSLQRGNTVSNRCSHDNKNAGASPGLEASHSRPVSRGRDISSRPTSNHAKERNALASIAGSLDQLLAAPKPDLPKPEADAEKSSPTSPARTMDPRRWSPHKGSSWLEAALKQPESPKSKPATVPSNQPVWMVELNRAKAERAERAKNASVELGREGSIVKRPEVKIGGLVRPTPPGTAAKPPNLSLENSPTPPSEKPLTPVLRSGGFTNNPVNDKPSPWTPPTPPVAGPERTSSIFNPAPGKDKLDTPPVKNFRSSLRSRGMTLGNLDGGQSVSELANVFGNLRKAKPQNYVAPDELKDNILRGKSALIITGGPRQYEKKDEFKDAILKKKADFNQAKHEGRGVTPSAKPQQEEPVPEAIRRRATISRSKSISHSRNTSLADISSTAVVSPRTSEFSPISRNPYQDEEVSKREENISEPSEFPTLPKETPKDKPVPDCLAGKVGGGALADRFNPALAAILARGPPGAGAATSRPAGTSSETGVTDAGIGPGPGPQLTHMTKNRARGPHRKAPAAATSKQATQSSTSSAKTSTPAATTSSSAPGPDASKEVSRQKVGEKGASSPAPPAEAEEIEKSSTSAAVVEAPIPKPLPAASPLSLIASPVTSPVTSTTELLTEMMADVQPRSSCVISSVDSSKKRLAEERPSTGTRIALVDAPTHDSVSSGHKIHEPMAGLTAKTQEPEEKKYDEPPPRSPSPKKLDAKRISRFLDESAGMEAGTKTETKSPRSTSPVKKTFGAATTPQKPSEPEKVDSQPDIHAKNGTRAALFGPSITPVVKAQPKEVTPASPVKNSRESVPPEKPMRKAVPAVLDLRPESPAITFASRALPAEPHTPPNFSPLSSPTRSPSKSGADVSNMLMEFFGTEPPKRKYYVDAGEVLMSRPRACETVQTQNAQLFQVTEQGIGAPVPSHYERVLFEREMYICTHTFTNAASKKMQEVYFWIGDDVASSTVDQVRRFVNREARSLGGTLIQIRQGKETAKFIQALGGVAIIRRGSSIKYDSLASNMLCGRSFLGQIVFDEVDFNPLSLCSGFPYIITQSAKCYLWKGKGSDVDELSCARLIGMDSALTCELLEIEEGNEPDKFWDLFDGQKKVSSADHWRLKPSYDKYCGRLFCSDAADRRQIMEIHPFSQTDLSPFKIYVLDAFFEMYIIVGRNAQAEYASFHNALDFAQEYAILAAGLEDRPFVPVSTVVLEGIPRDLRSCFRKWRDELSPTRTVTTPSQPLSGGGGGSGGPVGGRPSPLRRARSLKILPLGQALQALQALGGAK